MWKQLAPVLFLTIALAACGDDASPKSDGNNTNRANSTDNTNNTNNANNANNTNNANAISGLPGLSELVPGKYNEILTGGETTCSRGTEYAFYVWPGASDKFVVDFFGGGACWDALTCSVSGSIFSENIDDLRALSQAENPDLPGMFDMNDERNPIRDWTHIIVPYCTGDVHWGDAVTTYGSFDINHKGAVNTGVIMDWLAQNMPQADKAFVTGCSAGSYGSIMWSAHVAERWPDAKVYQFGDSGAGIITQSFFEDSFPSWNAAAAFPSWIDALDPGQVDIQQTDLPYLYNNIAAAYPNAVFSQYNTVFDENQTFYYEAMGGEGGAEGWSMRMQGNVSQIKESSRNYYNWIAEGEQHCIIPYDNFYTVETNGVALVDWLDDMINDQPLDNVECVGCVTTP